MIRSFNAIVPGMLTLCLAGCGDPTYEDMLADKALLQDTLDECQQQGMAAYDQQVCKDAQQAAMKVTMDAMGEAMGGAMNEAMEKVREGMEQQ